MLKFAPKERNLRVALAKLIDTNFAPTSHHLCCKMFSLREGAKLSTFACKLSRKWAVLISHQMSGAVQILCLWMDFSLLSLRNSHYFLACEVHMHFVGLWNCSLTKALWLFLLLYLYMDTGYQMFVSTQLRGKLTKSFIL